MLCLDSKPGQLTLDRPAHGITEKLCLDSKPGQLTLMILKHRKWVQLCLDSKPGQLTLCQLPGLLPQGQEGAVTTAEFAQEAPRALLFAWVGRA